MEDKKPSLSLAVLRWVTLFAPPIALILLWLSPSVGRRQKLLGTIGIPLYAILYFTAIFWGLHVWFGIDLYEWRGGYNPTITWKPTQTDFDALEARLKQQGLVGMASNQLAGGVHWTGFRGPNRDGIYAEQTVDTDWINRAPKLLWKQPIGGGYASFAVANGLAYTIEQRRALEVVVAYELQTGREVWTNSWEAQFQESIGGDGPRATPTWADGRLYAQGANGELRCLEAKSGELLWRHDVIKEFKVPMLEYGCSVSPLVVDDLVVTLPGGTNGNSMVAFDRLSGALKWRSGDDRQAYVSPMVVTLAGERQLLVVAAKRVMGVAISDGRVLWGFPWGEPLMGRNVAQPVVWNGNRVMVSAGYFVGCTALEVTQAKGVFQARELWRNKNLKNKFSSSIYWQGYIYGLDEEILTCIDAITGERMWKDGRYGYGQLIMTEGHLVILCGNGDLALIKATPEGHQEVTRIAAIKGKTWNHPVIADGKLLVRNLYEMACFDLMVP
jgi:outer membrane protein assembly factor BamB